MTITPDLLMRYFQDTVTPAERQTVVDWLAQSGSEEGIPDAWANPVHCPPQSEQAVRDEIWRAIDRSQSNTQERFLACRINWPATSGRLVTTLTAACLTLWMGYGWLGGLVQTSVIDTSHRATAQTLRVNHLRLIVQPGSRCTVTTSPFDFKTNVQFQGAVAITPERDDYDPETLTVECTDSHKKDGLRLLPGQTFLAMTDDVYQLITATTDELNDDIPRPFSARLVNRFRL
ncbi:hypothetical protein M0L20_23150 [Spirosoma sp. RP8]|uniref:Uncharacterized protein n=1 Tax=Spirosoma liriopis TaxID=2937440 RepID=A0ABT0HS23_9BACT|nr:hypothetical protein [Spirosoma liriopis]MCK8494785.1 hypothetical protein [Spirosoma liriopis]